jgi:nicotinate-nucleotide pyrophosphorylase (carboxylating)
LHPRTETLVRLALEEDTAYGDVTGQAIFPPGHVSSARVLARSDAVVCGITVAEHVFKHIDAGIELTAEISDGDRAQRGTVILQAEGPTVALLAAERTALNFLQRLSGIATLSRAFADAAVKAGTGVRIVDTRKTTPGWRHLEKYAVRCGGCHNHRFSLGEHVLIKENHIAAAGSLASAVKKARDNAPHTAKIEVETETLDNVAEALAAGVEVIMLDNMSPALIREAVAVIDGAALVEVSGGVTLDNLADYALPGVDVISVGALTHSAPAADFSMIIPAQGEARP